MTSITNIKVPNLPNEKATVQELIYQSDNSDDFIECESKYGALDNHGGVKFTRANFND